MHTLLYRIIIYNAHAIVTLTYMLLIGTIHVWSFVIETDYSPSHIELSFRLKKFPTTSFIKFS